MKKETNRKIEDRIRELTQAGVSVKLSVVSMGCCGRSDGSYRCSSK